MTSFFLTLMESQSHTSRSKVTDVEVSTFSGCFLFCFLFVFLYFVFCFISRQNDLSSDACVKRDEVNPATRRPRSHATTSSRDHWSTCVTTARVALKTVYDPTWGSYFHFGGSWKDTALCTTCLAIWWLGLPLESCIYLKVGCFI